MKDKLEKISEQDGRYSHEAIKFVYEGLGYTVKQTDYEPRHISGQMLCHGLKQLAVERWGRLAKLVLNSWNVTTTRDFGEIVYLMIEHKWMSTTETDSIDDFNNVYNFKTVFKDEFDF